MLFTLFISYASAFFLGVTGYFMLGGVGWIWILFVWVGGAFTCLLVARTRLYLRSATHQGVGAPIFTKSAIVECGCGADNVPSH